MQLLACWNAHPGAMSCFVWTMLWGNHNEMLWKYLWSSLGANFVLVNLLTCQILCVTPNRYSPCFVIIWRLHIMVNNFHHLIYMFPAGIAQRDALSSCFSSHTIYKCRFCCKLFLCFCAFCWWFHKLIWPPGVVLKCCLMFLSTRRLWCALQRKTHVLDKLHSLLMTQ